MRKLIITTFAVVCGGLASGSVMAQQSLDQLLQDGYGSIDVDGITHAFNTYLCNFSAGYTDYLSGHVDQRSTTVTGVDSGAGLDKVK